jgi:hypothetical protein
LSSIARRAAAVLVATAAPACAGTLQLVDARSILGVRAHAGIAVVDANLPCIDLPFPDQVEQCSVQGSLGSLTSELNQVGPGRRALGGTGQAHAEESLWAASMSMAWSTWHEYSFNQQGADLVLQGAGRHESSLSSRVAGPGAEQIPEGIREVAVLNLLTLIFTLDSETGFVFSGSEFGEYMPAQLSRLAPSGEFEGEGNIPWSFSGTLGPGTYRLRNFHLLQTDSADEYAYGWEYSMSFRSTAMTHAAVPVPGTLALSLLTIAACAGLRRRSRHTVAAS